MSGDEKPEGNEKSSQMAYYEEMFKDRYTDKDPEFVKLKEKPLPPPPFVYPWEQFKRFRNDSYDRRQERRYGGNYRQYKDRNWDSHWRDRSDNWDRRDYHRRDESTDRRRHSYGHSSREDR